MFGVRVAHHGPIIDDSRPAHAVTDERQGRARFADTLFSNTARRRNSAIDGVSATDIRQFLHRFANEQFNIGATRSRHAADRAWYS